MSNPEIYPHTVSKLEQRETHISHAFLTGSYVYKIKKPIDLEFLDYTTLEKRKYYCHQETTINHRLSHDVYLGVVAITYDMGKYYLDGPGKPVEIRRGRATVIRDLFATSVARATGRDGDIALGRR